MSEPGAAIQLLPRPRRIDFTGGTAPRDAPVQCTHAGDLPAQGYVLEIDAAGVRLHCADDAGERYGRAAVEQIERQCAGALPGLRIVDWPDFPVRGYMLDISRDRVPTRETLARIVDLLELLRINHLQLYTEHTFAYAAHATVWRDASPMTGDDVAWLDALCAGKGIELAANQNGFGHMERWLRHDAYAHLAESPGGWTTSWGAHWRPAVLHPDAASRALVLDLYRELRAHFSSRRININFDETFELGKGRSREWVERAGRGRVYLDFLRPIIDALHGDGAEVLFWGDVVRKHPELIAELPARNLVALVWHYEAPVAEPALPAGLEQILAEVGIDENVLRGFAGQVPVFAGTGVPFWVCPGTSSWNSLLGRWSNARANLLDAAAAGLANAAQGYLITDWGDNGHMQPPPVSFAPLVYGACVAWCAEANRDLDVARALDDFVWNDHHHRLGAAAQRAAEVYRICGSQAFNGSPLFYALIGADSASLAGGPQPTAASIEQALGELAAAERDLTAAAPACADGELIQRELQQAIALARLGAARLAQRHGLRVDAGAAAVADLLAEQRACWLARSRPGGLGDSLARI